MTQFEARAVVRSYSFEVEQRLDSPAGTSGHKLGQALVQSRKDGRLDDITSPWRLFFETREEYPGQRNPITEILKLESARLREKWVVFYEKSTKNERLDLDKLEPTIEGVVSLVTAMTAEWQSKRKQGYLGKTQSMFHKFCGTLDSHSSLLKLLPEGNEYVSIFAGSLNAIIKASANHEKISEGLAEGLCVISERIEEAGRDLSLAETDAMKQLVANLYEHVFLFLNGVMDWIMQKRSKRLLDSFKGDFNERFEKEITRINEKAERVRILASQSSRAELRVARLTIESMSRDLRLGLNGLQRHQAEMRLREERMEKRMAMDEEQRRQQPARISQLGGCVVFLLEADAAKWVALQNVSVRPLTPLMISESFGGALTPPRSAIEDLTMNSRHLEDFFDRKRVRLPAEDFKSTLLGHDTVERIQEWSLGRSAPLLWLEGPALHLDDLENALTAVAAKFVRLAEVHDLTVLSYFCELPRRRSKLGQVSPEDTAAVSLLYALLRQMIEVMPPRMDTAIDFSERRFLELDGTLNTWSQAIAVFRDVLGTVPGIVFCVIDGLHWLDAKSTDVPLTQLLHVLRKDGVRVLFTTSGRSGCLLDEVLREETHSMHDMSSQRAALDLNW